jgi:hypothetical protein
MQLLAPQHLVVSNLKKKKNLGTQRRQQTAYSRMKRVIFVFLSILQYVSGNTLPGQRFGHSITSDDNGNLILFGGTYITFI